MNMKAEVRQQLLGNMIIGRCEQEEGIIFQASKCSGAKCIRFTTDTVCKLLPDTKRNSGVWKTGQLLQYEIFNNGTNLVFQLSLSAIGLTQQQKKKMISLLHSADDGDLDAGKEIIAIRQWKYTVGTDVQAAQHALNEIFEYELPFFEVELRNWETDHGHQIREFPKLDDVEILTEGVAINVHVDRYERNMKARKRCIAHYGTACQICGFDFGKVYGPEFAGKIEVHHIIPLSEIQENYVVDPIKDLIPVCSNCHTALHSKTDGVYRPDELKMMLNPL